MSEKQSVLSEFIKTVSQLRLYCPWDKKQTIQSLQKYLKEEYREVTEAIKQGRSEDLKEELGDLLFIIVLMSQISHENGDFNMQQVVQEINNKMINRHPHVFMKQEDLSEEALRKQWETIKSMEKARKSN